MGGKVLPVGEGGGRTWGGERWRTGQGLSVLPRCYHTLSAWSRDVPHTERMCEIWLHQNQYPDLPNKESMRGFELLCTCDGA